MKLLIWCDISFKSSGHCKTMHVIFPQNLRQSLEKHIFRNKSKSFPSNKHDKTYDVHAVYTYILKFAKNETYCLYFYFKILVKKWQNVSLLNIAIKAKQTWYVGTNFKNLNQIWKFSTIFHNLMFLINAAWLFYGLIHHFVNIEVVRIFF